MTTTPTPEEEPTPAPTESTPPAVFDAPKDAPEEEATGYAVYNRTLGQYVGSVTKAKPSAGDARKAVTKGHAHAVVRV